MLVESVASVQRCLRHESTAAGVHLSYYAVRSKRHTLVATVPTYYPPVCPQLGDWVLGEEDSYG